MLTKRPMRPRSWNLTLPLAIAKRVSSLPRPTFLPGLIGVPRWRTRIAPPSTLSPSNRFTPRRCAFESRTLRELPPAFLWAIPTSASGFDRLDLDRRVRLAVAAAPPARVLPLLEREHGDLLPTPLLEDGRAHRRAVDGG